jgi:hypothetical protein
MHPPCAFGRGRDHSRSAVRGEYPGRCCQRRSKISPHGGARVGQFTAVFMIEVSLLCLAWADRFFVPAWGLDRRRAQRRAASRTARARPHWRQADASAANGLLLQRPPPGPEDPVNVLRTKCERIAINPNRQFPEFNSSHLDGKGYSGFFPFHSRKVPPIFCRSRLRDACSRFFHFELNKGGKFRPQSMLSLRTPSRIAQNPLC